ncbi:hypothetical protein ACHAWU_010386 [Discostella pseudostelligera]|uniref:Uncharacterized protein n=1 Tax=Discostella pseudostelligera TaxID=259834 RepID=A0ABD3MXJ6_9STRA
MVAIIPRSPGSAIQPRLVTSAASLVASASSLSSIAPTPSFRRPYIPRPNMKGLFAGSGNASMSNPYIANAVIDLTQRRPEDLSLLYIGTASYDIAKFRHMQTKTFKKMGVTVKSLNVANQVVPKRGMEEALDEADIILVSGGNTLFAIDRWEYLGLGDLLRDAALSGKVMAGGSAGAICWFDGGHSDSMDPETYRACMLNKFGGDNTVESRNPAESSSVRGSTSARSKSKPSYDIAEEGETDVESDDESTNSSDWEYIRVEGLGIMPGLICPHNDRIQSNGVLRMKDFETMMKRHPHEVGIGIDHYAALEFNGADFRVLSIPGQMGSIDVNDGGSNVPGVWVNYVDENGIVHSKVCPRSGKVHELLQTVEEPTKHLLLDKKVEICRRENPSS